MIKETLFTYFNGDNTPISPGYFTTYAIIITNGLQGQHPVDLLEQNDYFVKFLRKFCYNIGVKEHLYKKNHS